MTAWWTTFDLSGVKSAIAERRSRMFSSFFQTLQKDEANLHSNKQVSFKASIKYWGINRTLDNDSPVRLLSSGPLYYKI